MAEGFKGGDVFISKEKFFMHGWHIKLTLLVGFPLIW